MHTYHFVTKWYFKAPVECVWQELLDSQAWPNWWKGWQKVTPEGQDTSTKVGAKARHEVRGFLPYSLRFITEITVLRRPVQLEIQSSGDLVGTGRFELDERDGGTYVTFYWDVATPRPLLDAVANLRFSRLLMELNHDYLMENGFRGLKLRLEGPAARFPLPAYHW